MSMPKPKDIWEMTPAEMDELLRYAAWLVHHSTKGTGAERVEVEGNLRRAAQQINPKGYTNYGPTPPTRTGLGDWTGD